MCVCRALARGHSRGAQTAANAPKAGAHRLSYRPSGAPFARFSPVPLSVVARTRFIAHLGVVHALGRLEERPQGRSSRGRSRSLCSGERRSPTLSSSLYCTDSSPRPQGQSLRARVTGAPSSPFRLKPWNLERRLCVRRAVARSSLRGAFAAVLGAHSACRIHAAFLERRFRRCRVRSASLEGRPGGASQALHRANVAPTPADAVYEADRGPGAPRGALATRLFAPLVAGR